VVKLPTYTQQPFNEYVHFKQFSMQNISKIFYINDIKSRSRFWGRV